MMTAQIREKAHADFLSGKSLREISGEPGMPCKRTLERWSVQDHWVADRRHVHAQARKKASAARESELAREFASADAQKDRLMATVVAQLTDLMEGKLSEAELAIPVDQLVRLVGQLAGNGPRPRSSDSFGKSAPANNRPSG